jgi:hypothetical protein
MKTLAILAIFVSLGIGSAAYLTTTPETRTVTIEPYQVPVYEDANVSYQEAVYKTVDKTTYVQKTETKYKDETRYRTVNGYGSVTYYSGWLQIVYASEITFSKATSANCESSGLSIGVSEMYTCTIVDGTNAGIYTLSYFII